MKATLLIDHANCASSPGFRLRSALEKWIGLLGARTELPRSIEVVVRVYGGWWVGEKVSDERTQAGQYYSENCPSIIEVQGTYVRPRLEFANFLAEDIQKERPITATVAHRAKPLRLQKARPEVQCNRGGCAIKAVVKWSRSGNACPASGCEFRFDLAFRRPEQKQVDVHLALDILHILRTSPETSLAVATSDIDVTPAILAGLLVCSNRPLLALIRPEQNNQSQSDRMLAAMGVEILSVGTNR